MIFVVEVPEQSEPSAWFAFDVDDLMRKIEARDGDAAGAPGPAGEGDARGAGLSSADVADGEGEAASRCRIFWDEAQATAAFEQADHPLWQLSRHGWRARLALREQLLATEVLADDL